MTIFSKVLAEIWRDYKTDGVAATGVQAISKSDMRTWGAAVEAAVSGSQQGVIFAGDYDNLNAAITAAGSTETTLLIAKPMDLIGTITAPRTLRFAFAGNGRVNRTSGVLTINGPFVAPLQQVFTGITATQLLFGSTAIDRCYPDWFGAAVTASGTTNAAAFQAALQACLGKAEIAIGGGTYTFAGSGTPSASNGAAININPNTVPSLASPIVFRGLGQGLTRFKLADGNNFNILEALRFGTTPADLNLTIQGITFDGNGANQAQVHVGAGGGDRYQNGLYLEGLRNVSVIDSEFVGASYHGLHANEVSDSLFDQCYVHENYGSGGIFTDGDSGRYCTDNRINIQSKANGIAQTGQEDIEHIGVVLIGQIGGKFEINSRDHSLGNGVQCARMYASSVEVVSENDAGYNASHPTQTVKAAVALDQGLEGNKFKLTVRGARIAMKDISLASNVIEKNEFDTSFYDCQVHADLGRGSAPFRYNKISGTMLNRPTGTGNDAMMVVGSNYGNNTTQDLVVGDAAGRSNVTHIVNASSTDAGGNTFKDMRILGSVLTAQFAGLAASNYVEANIGQSDLVPSAISARADNYGPSGWRWSPIVRLSTSGGAQSITGFEALADGVERLLYNAGPNALTLSDGDTNSSAANRLKLGGNLVLGVGQSFKIRYSTSLSLWISASATALPPELVGLGANTTNGFWSRSGVGTGNARTLAGTANEITVTNGDGVSGAPTFGFPATISLNGKTVNNGTFAGLTSVGISNTGEGLKLQGTNGYMALYTTGGTRQGYIQVTASGISMSADGSNSFFFNLGGSDRVVLASGGQVYFPGVGTTASAANAFLDNASSPANSLLRSTSSIAYKKDVETIGAPYAEAILQLRPVWYRSKAPADNPAWGYYGLIAEEVAKVDPRLVHWGYQDDQWEDVPVEEEYPSDEITVEDYDEEYVEVEWAEHRQVVEQTVTLDVDGVPREVPVRMEVPAWRQVPVTKTRPAKRAVVNRVTKTRTKIERRLKEGAEKRPDGVMYDRIGVLLLKLLQDRGFPNA